MSHRWLWLVPSVLVLGCPWRPAHAGAERQAAPCHSLEPELAAKVEQCLEPERAGGEVCEEAAYRSLALWQSARDDPAALRFHDCAAHLLKRAYFELGRTADRAENLAYLYWSLAQDSSGKTAERSVDLAARVMADFGYSRPGPQATYFLGAGHFYRDLAEAVSEPRDIATYRDRARSYYRLAGRLTASSDTVSRNVLSVSGHKPKNLYLVAEELHQRGFLRTALDGYEHYLNWLSREGTGALSRFWGFFYAIRYDGNALIQWVEAAAALGNVTETDLARLPTAKEATNGIKKAIRELHQLVADPVAVASGELPLEWWLKRRYLVGKGTGHYGRAAIARLMARLARSRQAAGHPDEAILILESALHDVAPRIDSFEEPGAFALTDVAVELAQLYASFGEELDPQGEGRRRVVRVLDKALLELSAEVSVPEAAATDECIEAARRLEDPSFELDEEEDFRLLEEIYATQSRMLTALTAPQLLWQERRREEIRVHDTELLARARCYLEHSLAADARLNQTAGRHAAPQPELEELAAEMDDLLGRSREARWMRLRAAAGYLDLDAVGLAAELLETGVDSEELAPLVDLRRRIANGESLKSPLVEIEGAAERLLGGEGQRTPFGNRQRFKLFVDAGQLLHEQGRTGEAVELLVYGIEELARLRMLGSVRDLARIEQAIGTLLDRDPFITLGMGLAFNPPRAERDRYPLALGLPSDRGRSRAGLYIGADVFFAARLRWLLVRREVRLPEPVVLSMAGQSPYEDDEVELWIYAGANPAADVEALVAVIEEAIDGGDFDFFKTELQPPEVLWGRGLRAGSEVDDDPPELKLADASDLRAVGE